MGSVANDMITGICCEACGEYLECDQCADMGIPMYCSEECAKDRGIDAEGLKVRVCPNVHGQPDVVCTKCDKTIEPGYVSYDQESNPLCFKCNGIK